MSDAVQLPMEMVSERVKMKVAYKSMQAFRLQRIYIVAALFILFGLMQLMIIKILHIKLIDSLPVPSLMWMIIALVCLLLMVFAELFNKFPINWTLGIVAVESVTLCTVCYKWNHLPVLHAAIILSTVIVIHLILYALGACLPLALLPGYYGMLYITIVYIVIYIFISIIVLALARPNLRLMIDFWSFLYMMALMLYTSTLIHHRRLPNMISEEYILSATVIASFFLFMIYLFTNAVTYTSRIIAKSHY